MGILNRGGRACTAERTSSLAHALYAAKRLPTAALVTFATYSWHTPGSVLESTRTHLATDPVPREASADAARSSSRQSKLGFRCGCDAYDTCSYIARIAIRESRAQTHTPYMGRCVLRVTDGRWGTAEIAPSPYTSVRKRASLPEKSRRPCRARAGCLPRDMARRRLQLQDLNEIAAQRLTQPAVSHCSTVTTISLQSRGRHRDSL